MVLRSWASEPTLSSKTPEPFSSRQWRGARSVSLSRTLPGHQVGDIVFLEYLEVQDSEHIEAAGLDKNLGALGHPALIVSGDEGPEHHRICILTSFGGRGLPDWSKSRNECLAITHGGRQQDVDLAEGASMDKQTYVKVGESWRVHRNMLSPYMRGSRRLKTASMLTVDKAVSSRANNRWRSRSWSGPLHTATPPQTPSRTPSPTRIDAIIGMARWR